MNEQVYKLCLLGATDKQIANIFNVSEQTINTWKEKEPEFLESLKEGKLFADANVSKSLYERANGYVTTEERLVDGVVITLRKYHPPDPTSMIFWLKNRQPTHWRDKQEIDQTTKNHHTVEYKNVSKQFPDDK